MSGLEYRDGSMRAIALAKGGLRLIRIRTISGNREFSIDVTPGQAGELLHLLPVALEKLRTSIPASKVNASACSAVESETASGSAMVSACERELTEATASLARDKAAAAALADSHAATAVRARESVAMASRAVAVAQDRFDHARALAALSGAAGTLTVDDAGGGP